ncbi:MAG TPA: hypothetical protein PLK90_00045 [Clostridiales bacterium]|nr:hypothetical protein [Clostridiales bacterium]HQP68774.1 hypothetical protein [Clostridiales bacterium]
MKKLTIILSILAFLGLANAQFKNGLTNEVPNLRVNAMGNVYSLIETSNYADFPQRLLTGQEGAWIGANFNSAWGLARFNLNNFLSLPVPMAWQISAEQMSDISIDDLFEYVGIGGTGILDYDPAGVFGTASIATNRINSIFSIGLKDNLLVGLGLKMYSNSNSEKNDVADYDYEHSFWGLETTWGGTMILDDKRFIDASIDLDFWSWDGSFDNGGTDVYETGFTECDGVMNIGLNARYYNTGAKVDYAPYLKFNYLSASVKHGINPTTTASVDATVMNFTLGSGVHYKPADGVKVYNDFEFRYQNLNQDYEGDEASQTTMTLLPTYKMGVELVKDLNPEDFWFNSIQLWGGFSKTFADITGETEDTESTEPTVEGVSITTGFAASKGNFKLEMSLDDLREITTVDPADNEIQFNLGLSYMFQK